MISAVVVAIPARDEEATLPACLTGVRAAADAVSVDVEVIIVVAADSCRDRSAAVVRQVALDDPRIRLVVGRWGAAGAARRAATTHGLDQLVAASPHRTWVASTDADSVAPAGWLVAQLRYAAAGWHAVAGIVTIADRDAVLHARFVAGYPVRLDDGSHPHVHGANLGVRADAYRAVGGWPTCNRVGEDQQLCDALRLGHHPVLATTDLTVATSDRRVARAPEGFAARLRELSR